MIDIVFGPEAVAEVAGLRITNTALTSALVTSLFVVGLCARGIARRVASIDRSLPEKALRAFVLEALRLTDSVTGDRELSKRVLPLAATLFVYILVSNLLGLVPGFLGSFYVTVDGARVPLLRSAATDLTTTLALAAVAVVSVQYFSLRALGPLGYLKRFFDLSSPTAFVMGAFELVSESVKVVSFSFRLFGNVFAGEVLLLVAAFIFPVVLPIPFLALETFVGTIQAFIFAVLALAFVKGAVTPRERAIAGGGEGSPSQIVSDKAGMPAA